MGHMTSTETVAMISLVHVGDSAPRAWGGARKKVALSAKVGDAVCIRGPWGMGPGCL